MLRINAQQVEIRLIFWIVTNHDIICAGLDSIYWTHMCLDYLGHTLDAPTSWLQLFLLTLWLKIWLSLPTGTMIIKMRTMRVNQVCILDRSHLSPCDFRSLRYSSPSGLGFLFSCSLCFFPVVCSLRSRWSLCIRPSACVCFVSPFHPILVTPVLLFHLSVCIVTFSECYQFRSHCRQCPSCPRILS